MLRGPAPYPPEWQWRYRSEPVVNWGPWAAACAAGLLALLAVSGLADDFVSYGAAVFVLIGSAVAAAADPRRLRHIGLASALMSSTAIAISALPALLGHDPIAAARTALGIHRSQFTLPRSYSTWLLFNVWDVAVFLGLPIALLAIAGAVRALRATFREGWRWPAPHERILLVLTACLTILLLSGSVRGEAGRIWIPLMPFVLVASLLTERTRADTSSGDSAVGPSVAEALTIGLLLLASCWVLRLSWHLP